MRDDDWAEAHEPLEMLDILSDAPPHADNFLHYTLHCLRAFGAAPEADLVRQWFGPLRRSDRVTNQRQQLEARAARRSGGSYSLGGRPRRVSLDAQRARAALAALADSPKEAAVGITRETQHHLKRDQCGWLRCLFPNPLREMATNPAWLTSTVLDLARGAAAEQAFDRLPILADALQDAGCEAVELLGHCRHDGGHLPQCWVVRALLGEREGSAET